MHYDGPTFRPPYEADSILLQVTKGCSHNACRFCVMYKGQAFGLSPLDEVEADVIEASQVQTWATRVFLENGDAFCLPADRLLKIADMVHEHLPNVDVITGYARIQNVATKTDEELAALAAADYDQINIGVESGLDQVLDWMNKGYSVDQAREQLLRLRKAGIRFSLNIINAAAGPDLMARSAAANAVLCNQVQPYLIFVSPLHVDPGSAIEWEVASGRFVECDLGSYIDEEIAFLEALELEDCVFYGMHVSNPVPCSGWLPRDKERLLEQLHAGKARFTEEQLRSHPAKGAEGRLRL
ncbi:MAG: radical SAM protein [Coriobacteriia bacterium]|nr:radical SAM protein [Coriobacteriia bacterium]